jgi:two-component system chemotaxis response regulator CheY
MAKTILVVDDDPLYVELIKDVLEMQHHRVVVAHNGAQALSLVTGQQFDVVVSDIEMPILNGVAFHKKLTEIERYRTIPFVFLTATEDPEKLRYVREHPPATLLNKSDMIEALLATITKVTGSNNHKPQ